MSLLLGSTSLPPVFDDFLVLDEVDFLGLDFVSDFGLSFSFKFSFLLLFFS